MTLAVGTCAALDAGFDWSPLPWFVTDDLGLEMRVHEESPKTTVFVGQQTKAEFVPRGTAFLMARRMDEQWDFYWLVTAKHVVDLVSGHMVYVRANALDGSARVIALAKNNFIYSDNPAEDLAIGFLPGYEMRTLSQKFIKADFEAWQKSISDAGGVAPGDEAATVGLYSSHHGELKNIPIVRTGNVALLPGEPVKTSEGFVKAYLIETKSIAGLSGSPVFLNLPHAHATTGGTVSIPIGMVLGYHVVGTTADQIRVPQTQGENVSQDELSLDERNTGLSVVLPIERVYALMETRLVRTIMQIEIDKVKATSGYRKAGVKGKISDAEGPFSPADPPEPDNPDHKEDFTRLLNAAATTQSPKGRT